MSDKGGVPRTIALTDEPSVIKKAFTIRRTLAEATCRVPADETAPLRQELKVPFPDGNMAFCLDVLFHEGCLYS